jgi:pre-mRNA 3'-end-processing factor FIP1
MEQEYGDELDDEYLYREDNKVTNVDEAESVEEQEEESEMESDEDDVEIVLENEGNLEKPTIILKSTSIGNNQASIEPTKDNLPPERKPVILGEVSSININGIGEFDGQNILDVELDSTDKPWLRPGADITDYFNYGFTEMTWKKYAFKQKQLREEYGIQKKINVFDSSSQLPYGRGGPSQQQGEINNSNKRIVDDYNRSVPPPRAGPPPSLPPFGRYPGRGRDGGGYDQRSNYDYQERDSKRRREERSKSRERKQSSGNKYGSYQRGGRRGGEDW